MNPIMLWPQGAPFATGIATHDCPSIDTFLLQSDKPTAMMIICPGGGYEMRASSYEGTDIALWMNRIGISAIVLNYRVKPYKHPCSLLDAQRAIRYVRSHAAKWNIDPSRIGILGFSAGGHLASMAGTIFDAGDASSPDPIETFSCRPDAMVLCYPVISFIEYCEYGSMMSLIGKTEAGNLQQTLSTETRVTADSPPAFIWHTADDKIVHNANSLLFASALSRCGVPFELHIYQNGPHGMGLAEHTGSVGLWTRSCELWLNKIWEL